MNYRILKQHKSFSGKTIFCEHESNSIGEKMKFSCFLPKADSKPTNAIIWLSGLTCNEENFITKSGIQKILSNTNTMIICPDTSPRNSKHPKEHESYDFGSGAGFYVNATTEFYNSNYKMYDYISKDIVELLKTSFEIQKISISGHSMGGHGALVLGLRENTFSAISAFSPIVNPSNCPWGQKAFSGYLGEDKTKWAQYDACELIKSGAKIESSILIDQGLNDEFYIKKQLLTENLETVCTNANQKLKVNYREGFDHSYYFIASFLESHIKFLTHSMI